MPNTVNSYIETDLGNVSPNPRGEYNATYDYEYLDLIYYKGGSYLCLAPFGETIKNVPPIEGQTTTNWQCVAIPGDLTPEYISMYNEVVKDYNETNTNTADVAQMKDITYASMTAAQESESKASTSETNARNSEVSAKQSMDKAKEYSDEAIRVNNDTQSLVTGFDEHVATAISNAEASISESTDNAKGEIVAQKSSSLNEFRTDAETVMTNEKNVAVAEIHQMVDSFSADADSKKQEVIQVADEKINDMTSLKNDTVNAKNAAETAATTAVEKAEEAATSANNSKVNENAVTEMKISIEQSQSDIQTKQIQVSSDAQQVSSDKSDILIMKSSIEDTAEKVNIDVKNGLKQISDSKDNSLVDIQNKKNEVIADIEQYGALQVSNEEPISENVDLWINPDNEEEYSIPEIKDGEVNASDTWSSEKIFGEISELKSDLNDLESEIFESTNGILQNNVRLNKLARTETVLNLFNKATSVDGYALSESGQLYASVEYTVSDFILLPSKSKVYVYYFDGTTVIQNPNVYICFYTYNKEMTGTRIQSNYVTDVPVGAKYIRIAPSIQRKDTVMLFANDEPCAPSEYVQYMDGVNNKFAFEDKIAEMEETLSGFTPIVKEVADNLNLASFEKGTAISKNATYNTYYIHTNGNLSSLGEQYTNYNVFEYRLEANKKYVLSGRVALNGDLPLFGVKDTSGTSGKVTILKSIGKNYEDVYIEYTAEKDEYLFVAAYSIRGELLVYNAIVSYDYNDVVRARSIQSITNPWYGKKVVWLGTSVPAGQYADTSYAYEVAKYLGINLVNTSIPGLSIHLNENGEPRLSPYAGSSSATIAEYEAVGVTIPTSKTASGYYKSYEHIFEEENADADLYVFDVAPNNGNFDMSDWDAFNKNTWAYNDGTPFSEHRKTFLGALLFLMDKMYTLNPKARMVFVLGSSFAYTNGKEAFETVSAQWNIPIINVWEKINTSPKSLPIIKSKDGTDNHPSTYAHQCMGKMLIGEFLKIG